MPDISVIMCTYNRSAILARSLQQMCAMDFTGVSVEIIVADNNSTDNTREVVDGFRQRLPIQYCFEPVQGQNAARNAALRVAAGDLLLFTDDDILVNEDWLREWSRGVGRWPKHDLFGGAILPEWPGEVPGYLADLPFRDMAYCILDPQQEEGPFAKDGPWSGNLGIRHTVFRQQGCRFNQEVGPRPGDYIMGSESELLLRLKKAGHVPIFLPRVGVRHVISESQLTPQWLYGRSFRYGRAMWYHAPVENGPRMLGVPRYLLRYLIEALWARFKCVLRGDRNGRIHETVRYWMVRGHLHQARQSRSEGQRA